MHHEKLPILDTSQPIFIHQLNPDLLHLLAKRVVLREHSRPEFLNGMVEGTLAQLALALPRHRVEPQPSSLGNRLEVRKDVRAAQPDGAKEDGAPPGRDASDPGCGARVVKVFVVLLSPLSLVSLLMLMDRL